MKVPRSTYVMGVAVLGLFGLAIAKSAGGKDRHHGDGDDDYEEPESLDDEEQAARDRAQMERELATHKTAELERERSVEKLTAELGTVYGAEAASMGSLFAGVTFGIERGALPTEVKDRLDAFIRNTQSSLSLGDRIELRPHIDGEEGTRDALCGRLSKLFKDTWGAGTRASVTATTIWLNPATHVRATFVNQYSECELSFSPYAAPQQWIGRGPTSVIPLAAVGQPAAKLADAVRSAVLDETITWVGPGLGVGTQPTQLVAIVVRGKIAQLTATTIAVEDTRDELIEHLTTKLGTPKSSRDETGSESMTWPGKPQIVLFIDEGDTLTLTVGKI